MRITLEFISGTTFSLPLSYHHILQGFIYKQLKNFPEYASFLHNKGFQYNNTNRNFKLFSFSTLQGNYRIIDKKIFFSEGFRLMITSIDTTFCNLLVNAFMNNPNLEIAFQPVKLKNMTLENDTIEQDSLSIRMLSPLTVHKTFLKEDGRKHTQFLSPEDPEFMESVNDNFRRKYQAYFDIPTTDSLFIKALNFSSKNKYVTRFKNNITIVGWKGDFLLQGNPNNLNFLYHCGLGAKNSQGFGMFEISFR